MLLAPVPGLGLKRGVLNLYQMNSDSNMKSKFISLQEKKKKKIKHHKYKKPEDIYGIVAIGAYN